MTLLDSFKQTLHEKLDSHGFQAVDEVLREIEASGYDYDKPTFANLRNLAMETIATLMAGNYITKLKVFIDTLHGEYRKKIRVNIPLRPNYFVGRKDKLAKIHEQLTGAAADRDHVLLLSGVGGMGKTTLMQEYLYQDDCLNYFNGIVTISVNKNLRSAFLTGISTALGKNLSDYHKQEDQLRIVLTAMQQSEGNNLLVVDNINEYDFDDLLAMKKSFDESGWKILITTRTIPDGFNAVRVDELNMEEALSLFAFHYAPGQVERHNSEMLAAYIEEAGIKKSAEDLLGHIVRHTLLTELLAKVGRKKGFTVDKLLTILKEQELKSTEFERDIEIGRHNRESISTSQIHKYLLTLFETEYLVELTGDEKADKENRAKAIMLHFFSVLPAEDIPIEDLKKLWQVEKENENSFEDRLDQLNQIGWLLGRQGVVHISGSQQNLQYKMHPLVQDVVYEKLKPNIDSCRPLVKTITQILSQPLTFPIAYQGYAKSVVDKLNVLSTKK